MTLKKKNTTESCNGSIPYYKLYPTPIYNRDEQHKHASPLLSVTDFTCKKTLKNAADQFVYDSSFDKKCIRNERYNNFKF